MGQRSTQDALTVKVHRGEGAALLAFDVEPGLADGLAGFAVERITPEGDVQPLKNRLTFDDPVVAQTTPAQRRALARPTSEAPLQTFHWVDFPPRVPQGTFSYRVTAMQFAPGSETALQPGPQTQVDVDLRTPPHASFELGFTRGYVSSQAYADLFHNAPLAPTPQTIDYDTRPFADQYRWLGFAASRMVFDFLAELEADPQLTVDVFAFDFDEVAILHKLAALGSRVRLFLDDSDSHVDHDGKHALETDAHALIASSAGADHVRVGHFGALAHSKVLIQRRGGTPVKVIAGSMNFSLRGLYVQSNNVFRFDDPEVAGRYGAAFDQAWTQPLASFDTSPVAAGWFERSGDGLPDCAVAFSPHTRPEVSLRRVADAIAGAEESVLFSIMEIGTASGPVMEQVLKLPQRSDLAVAYGTTQKIDGALKVFKSGAAETPFVPFGFLKEKVPPPFDREIATSGIQLHQKMVVCDFNGRRPIAFAGSSNLAGRAETVNGDNLVMFADGAVATAFAVEAIQLADHYRFRAIQRAATSVSPLRLKRRGEDWAHDFFEPDSPRSRERTLFAR
ncbi:MAG: hypothetical protein JSS99_15450 [Actinobacteria bacterium]|nr:hypothetical protein [Actinomycetota bacterium]